MKTGQFLNEQSAVEEQEHAKNNSVHRNGDETFSQSPLPTAVLDFDLNIVRGNRAFASMISASHNGLSGLNLKGLLNESDQARAVKTVEDIKTEKTHTANIVKRLTPKDGPRIWVSSLYSPIKDESGRPKAILCIVKNRTAANDGDDSSHLPADKLPAALGAVVHMRRTGLGLSQEELAEKVGLHRTYISDVECGTRNVTLKTLERLATGLRTRMSALLDHCEDYVREQSGSREPSSNSNKE